jgi:hypothetical protein
VDTIEVGQKVIARSSADKLLQKRALTGIVMGEDFPVIWVCREEEWQEAIAEGRETEGVPWPADAVEPYSA